ncbi:MAG: NAD-dependent epimerase/dehydratase family protein [Deltaproteobacteria bacterium]|nr:NAD-dependent epimerase/dehydratase family protein [Deltaproteobacteria bacterium]
MSKAIFGNTLVTGATGLLGSELVQQLLKNNETSRLVCLVRDQLPQSRYYVEEMHQNAVTIWGDVRDQNLLDRVINEYEINTVFHLAAQTLVQQANLRPTETLDVNIRGTWAVLEACRLNSKRIQRVICASSDKAYGNLNGEKYDESYPLEGKHPYDVSKSCSDLITQTYAHSFGMNVAITRCGNFFGPGDLNESRIIPHTIVSLLKNQAPVIRSDGKFIRDYIYVGDGAAAYRLLAKKMVVSPMPGEAFNFSYELRLSVLDLVDRIQSIMGKVIPPQILNQAFNEIPVQSLDSTKAKKALNWVPLFGFEEGIRQTVDWYRGALEKKRIQW